MTPFIILGAPKSSTSTVVALCNAHPRVLALFEIDFARAADFNRNAEFTARYPETRKLFGTSLTMAASLTEVAAILRAQGHDFDFVGTKIPVIDAERLGELETKTLFVTRDVRTWAAKSRIYTLFMSGGANAVPVLGAYVGYLVRSFRLRDVLRLRLEDMLRDPDAFARRIGGFFGLPGEGFERWWTQAPRPADDPKSFPWTNGHRSAFLPPVVNDTQVTLEPHPVWDNLLPIFDKYFAAVDGSFEPAEIDRDLAAIDHLCVNASATFEQLFRSVNSARLHDVQPKDGRFVATSYEVLVKEPGKAAQLKVAGAKD